MHYNSNNSDIIIYSDGCCLSNPGGAGGYGVVLMYKEHKKELLCGYESTTNNRMELLGVIAGLEALNRSCDVVIYSDSRYVVDSISKGWLFKWKANSWIKSDKNKALNIDLWERYLEQHSKHKVLLKWVKGHGTNKYNNRCDELAGLAARSKELLIDYGYVGDYKNDMVYELL